MNKSEQFEWIKSKDIWDRDDVAFLIDMVELLQEDNEKLAHIIRIGDLVTEQVKQMKEENKSLKKKVEKFEGQLE